MNPRLEEEIAKKSSCLYEIMINDRLIHAEDNVVVYNMFSIKKTVEVYHTTASPFSAVNLYRSALDIAKGTRDRYVIATVVESGEIVGFEVLIWKTLK